MCVFLSESSKVALNFSKNVSKFLNKGDWCFNKSANQARTMLDNKVQLNSIWAGLVRYWWGRSQMTKCTWLTKPWNFECVPSNLFGKLLCGSFGWGCVVKTHPKEVKTWLICKWATDSRNVWFSCSRFLWIIKSSSINVDMIMNIVKNDTNKRWAIHNLNQQEIGNLRLLEKNSFEEKG